MGFRVPPGFCLTTEAFRMQLAGLDSPAEIDAAPLGPAIAAPLRRALERLAAELVGVGVLEPRLAVRSSALGEDGSQASYAGLHETELDLAADAVPAAVARCWASLWSPAALAYRSRRGLTADGAAMAVVVQALVPAEASAVAFTRHPVTGREDQLVVTAVRGLGDAMVAGTVTPDTHVIDKSSRGTLAFDPGEDPRGPALDDDALAAIVDLALAVEAQFGAPVDVEAAFAARVWYLLQARPITALARA
jgi:phosphoenolpyruvate synthase/pyruvate phosphate dikinase